MQHVTRPPRIRTVLLVVHLLILALPLAGISLLRLYSTALARQTESELVIQGAILASIYRTEIERRAVGAATLSRFGRAIAANQTAGSAEGTAVPGDAAFDPVRPELDLARQQVLPPEPAAEPPAAPPDQLSLATGHALAQLLAETQRVSLAGIRIVDSTGVVVASSGEQLGLSLANRPEVARALRGNKAVVLRQRSLQGPKPAIDSISRDSNVRVVVGYPVRVDDRVWGAIVLARTPLSARQALWRDRHHLLLGGALLLGIVGLVTLLVSATITRPLDRLIAQTERVGRGEVEAASPLARPGTREVGQISSAVARLSRTLQQRADYIATFAAGLSHQLKTPLTSLQGSVELLRDHGASMSPEERGRFLDMLQKDACRIERLVDRLLDLARADVIRPGDATTEVRTVVERLAERFAQRGLSFRYSAAQLEGLVVAVSSEALDALLSNLLDNAFVHGAKADFGTSPTVELRASQNGRTVTFEIEDDGPGIAASVRERLFERFVTTRPTEGGSGLGLAIVAALVAAHGGSVHVLSPPPERPSGAAFVVTLPSVTAREAGASQPRASS